MLTPSAVWAYWMRGSIAALLYTTGRYPILAASYPARSTSSRTALSIGTGCQHIERNRKWP